MASFSALIRYGADDHARRKSMGEEGLQPQGERLRKAVRWISEMCKEHPERSRREIVLEAEQRFDLTPKECQFLNEKFLP